MIPAQSGHAFPSMPQPVAALLFPVNQQAERPSDISLNISYPPHHSLSAHYEASCFSMEA